MLGFASEVYIQKDKTGIGEDAVSAVVTQATIYMPFAELVDVAKEVERLDGLIADQEAKLQEMETVQDERTKALIETAESFSGASELDQKKVDALIEKVLIYDPEHVEIRWKFSDEAMKLLKE